MSRLPTKCPACERALLVTHLACSNCDMRLEGRFALPALLRLSRDDLAFVLEFVRCSGSLKELGKIHGQSYPTVRNRLNDVIERLYAEEGDPDVERRKVLDGIASGELTGKEGVKRLKELE